MRRRSLATLSILGLVQAGAGMAQTRPILRITGKVQDGARSFDLAGLEAVGAVELVTRTTWTGSEPQHFTGVPLARLLDAVGAEGASLRAVALNDYAVTLPFADAAEKGAFLATRLDGQAMRIRDRGPIWLVYPWSDRPELDIDTYRTRAIWQLCLIEVN